MNKRYRHIRDKYEVSDHGEVFSTNYNRTGERRQLKPRTDKDGYQTMAMCIGGVITQHKIHRLVAEAFIPNPNNLKEINHEDGNKKNNHYSNLTWCTRSYNNLHALNTGLKPKTTEKQVAAVKRTNFLKRGIKYKKVI